MLPGALPPLREAARRAGQAASDWDGAAAALIEGLRRALR